MHDNLSYSITAFCPGCRAERPDSGPSGIDRQQLLALVEAAVLPNGEAQADEFYGRQLAVRRNYRRRGLAYNGVTDRKRLRLLTVAGTASASI
jgi:hypothetical protein